ncbi:vacuolar protein sorting-associated protein 16B [Culicoides brevitarsis]|uniref:vacuolar protein sorting-associated protein 16B n=1 Tax=Culicoides brevitarsis TaxID=469753 RepID=UPI00307B95FF
MEEDDYWNSSANKSFIFDDMEGAASDLQIKHDKLVFDDAISESSYEFQTSEGFPMRSLISDADLKTILEEQCRNEPVLQKNITLEEEVKILRREKFERLQGADVDVTVTKMILGKPCSLEAYKSLRDKERLLDEAIKSKNGDAILHVVLFLSRTLKKKLFYNVLQLRPVALTYFVNYLKLKMQINECMDLLAMLGKNQEAAMIQFEAAALSCTNIDTKKSKLTRIYSDYFSQPGTNPFYANFVATYIHLLEFQLSEKAAGHANADTIVGSPVLETLNYVLGRHKWAADVTTPDNPFKFAEIYSVIPAQFEWVGLTERSRVQAWRDVESLFEKKSWHKAKTFQIHIPLEKAILQLYSLNAPSPVLNHFINNLDDPQRRLVLAKKVNSIRSVVDALVALKDKTELENLRDSLGQGTEEWFYAEAALKLVSSKWKTDVSSIKLIR